MKKRIFALLTAVILVCTAFVGCQTDDEKSARQIFLEALSADDFRFIDAYATATNQLFNMKGNLEITDAETVTKMDIDANVKTAEKLSMDGKFAIGIEDSTLGSESLDVTLAADGENYYITVPFIESAIKSAIEESEEDESTSIDLDHPLIVFLSSYVEYLQSEKLDSLFTKSEGELTVKEEKFENTTIITLDLTDDKVKELVGDEYKASNNDFDVVLKVEMAVKDGKAAAMKAVGTIKVSDDESEDALFTFTSECTDNGLILNGIGEVNGEEMMTVTAKNDIVDGKANFNAEIKISQSYDGEVDEEFNFACDEEVVIAIDYKENEAGKNGEGSVSLNVSVDYSDESLMEDSETAFSIPFTYNVAEDGTVTVAVTSLEMESMGMKISLDVTGSLSVKPIENGAEIGLDFNADIMGMTMGAKMNMTFTKLDNFEVNIPTETVNYEDVEEELISTMENEYPLIYSSFMADETGDGDYEYNYIDILSDDEMYSFYPDESIGDYFTTYTSGSAEDGNAVITLANGKEVEFTYDIDEENPLVVIGDMEFEIYEYTEDEFSDHMFVLSYYNGLIDEDYEYPTELITIYYYPETNSGDITAVFSFTSEGDNYTLTFADGTVSEKTILFDEETEGYYFG